MADTSTGGQSGGFFRHCAAASVSIPVGLAAWAIDSTVGLSLAAEYALYVTGVVVSFCVLYWRIPR